MPARASLEVVYNSELVISDPRELSTLSLFYDRVILPASSAESSRKAVLLEPSLSGHRLAAFDMEDSPEGGRLDEIFAKPVARWDANNRVLFDEGVLTRLREPDLTADVFEICCGAPLSLAPLMPVLLRLGGTHVTKGADGCLQDVYIAQDHVRHLLRSDVQTPSVFVSVGRPQREVLKALEAREVFRYLIPAVETLHPEQILQVREKVRDTREGFAMHLQTLSASVEARVKSGDSLETAGAYARSVVETTLIPDYREFRRQLLAERSGFWRGVLEAGAKVFEIDVPPWTPKFYGQLLKALGVGFFSTAEARKASLSNRSQAFQFMQHTEEAASRSDATTWRAGD